MKYAVSADGSQPDDGSYDTSIPTGKDAGTYYVWYFVEGDGNHNNTEPAYVTVTNRKGRRKCDASGGEGTDLYGRRTGVGRGWFNK